MILFMSKEYQLILIFTVMNVTKKRKNKGCPPSWKLELLEH